MVRNAVELKFSDVNEYRKAVGRELLSRLGINFSSSSLQLLEIGPGMHSELVEALRKNQNSGQQALFIEPHLLAAEATKAKLPSSRVIQSKLEDEATGLHSRYFDFIYANFSLHWSDRLPEVMQRLFEVLKPSGSLGFTITDQDRSFWALVNHSFKNTFQGCDLFNATEAKSLDPKGWNELLVASGFQVKEEIVFTGIASCASSAEVALEGFKKAVGEKYLKLNGISNETAERWILSEISRFADPDGKIEIPASGLGFICTN